MATTTSSQQSTSTPLHHPPDPPLPDTWTVLENLILAQAVYKHGEDSWAQVAKVLRGHAALDRPMEFFTPKNCEKQYQALLSAVLGDEQFLLAGQDMPPVAKLARRLHLQRIEEVKEILKRDEQEFRQLVQDIEEIKNGRWDDKLRHEFKAQQARADEGTEQPPASDLPTNEEGNTEAMDVDSESLVDNEADGEPADNDEDQGEGTSISPRRNDDPMQIEAASNASCADDTPRETPEPVDVDSEAEVDAPTQSVITKSSTSAQEVSNAMDEDVTIIPSESTPTIPPPPPSTTTSKPPKIPSLSPAPSITPSNSTPKPLHNINNQPQNASSSPSSPSHDPSILQTWKKTVNFILAKIADHRYGNVFSTPVKEEGYGAVVKQPMSLDLVRARVRKGITTTTPAFHRDLLLMLANAIMYNSEDSEVFGMALEMKAFVDAELGSLTKYGADPGRASVEVESLKGDEGSEGPGEMEDEEPDGEEEVTVVESDVKSELPPPT
ncbi:hypothetical protein DFS34DRAFT_481208 [Phlyctochytrium arcticum]|nr:hypothetical protein DFS34DRAFT_481208 [Phlyctochytrium arcticum]